MALLAAGLVAWLALLVSEPRLSAGATVVLLGALSGVHLALVAHLVALPRLCVTCLAACALSLMTVGTLTSEERLLTASSA